MRYCYKKLTWWYLLISRINLFLIKISIVKLLNILILIIIAYFLKNIGLNLIPANHLSSEIKAKIYDYNQYKALKC